MTSRSAGIAGVVGIAAMALLAGAEAAPAAPSRRPNFIIFLVDMLRPDHLGIYGYPKHTSPDLDRLARDGIVFDHAVSPAPWTLPSTISLLTGLLPSEHGASQTPVGASAREVSSPADPAVWLPRKFAERGYATAAFHTHPYLRPSVSEIHQAFGEYHDPALARVAAEGPSDASRFMYLDTLYPPCEAWLEENRDRAFLIYIHVIDVHGPYRELLLLDEDRAIVERGLADGSIALPRMPDSDAYRPTDSRNPHKSYLYDGHVRRVDRYLGRLSRKLEALGIAEDTYLVFTADHGEEFGEHRGYWGHGRYVYASQIRVPLLILSHHSLKGSARRIRSHVNTVGLLPTLAALAGIELAEIHRERSFERLIRSAREPEDWKYLSVSQTSLRGALDAITLDGRFKLITDRDNGIDELYDLRADPAERQPFRIQGLAGSAKARFDELVDRRRALRESRALPEPRTRQLDEAVVDALKALGYLP